ncbi:MAG TPA: hypothetical protein VKB26_13915, partial [Candidatus Acidoferrales bacterium]|nr:hypothetical protein [Candidatus Acidoferrales bacterium]
VVAQSEVFDGAAAGRAGAVARDDFAEASKFEKLFGGAAHGFKMREGGRGVKLARAKIETRGNTAARLKDAAISSRFPMAKNLLEQLKGGDRRSIGHSDQIAELVSKKPRLFAELFKGLWSEDPLVRMRAADAVEKVTRTKRELLQRYKKELLGLMTEVEQQEVRWHLAAMVSRLELNARERQRAVALLQEYLEDRSSIVRTFALQGLADLAESDESIRPMVMEILREAVRSGTAAMKARSRKLLARMERI